MHLPLISHTQYFPFTDLLTLNFDFSSLALLYWLSIHIVSDWIGFACRVNFLVNRKEMLYSKVFSTMEKEKILERIRKGIRNFSSSFSSLFWSGLRELSRNLQRHTFGDNMEWINIGKHRPKALILYRNIFFAVEQRRIFSEFWKNMEN